MARWLHDFLARLVELFLRIGMANVLAVIGIAFLGHGLWQYSPRVAEISVGIVLILAAALGVRSNGTAR